MELLPSPDFKNSSHKLILAHGAGAPMDSIFMNEISRELVCHGIGVARFEFEYMALRRTENKKKPPPKAEKLIEEYATVVEYLADKQPIFIGGKSMGGRVASLLAAQAYPLIEGVICLGYPFHPLGKKDKLRVEHFEEIEQKSLIVQGTRDPMGNADCVANLNLPEVIKIHWLKDGDHDFKPRKASGYTQLEHIQSAAKAVSDFIKAC